MSKLSNWLALGVSFQEESWGEYYPDAQALWPGHYAELAGDRRMPMGPDVAFYTLCEEVGSLLILTARAKGELIGYCLILVKPHPHYKSVLCGFEDSYWLKPEWRRGRTGVSLIKEAERLAKARGAKRLFFMTKLSKPLGKLFEYLGYTQTDVVYSKWIGD